MMRTVGPIVIEKHILNSFYAIGYFPQHDQVKHQLLEMINNSDAHVQSDGLRTDYYQSYMSNDVKREWEVTYKELVFPYLSTVFRQLGYDKIELKSCWFQQYDKNVGHFWHTHAQTNFSVVYYLDMPEGAPKTTVVEPYGFNQIEVGGPSGTISIFPAYAIHKAKENPVDGTRTVIAMNVDVDYDYDHMNLG
jgi:hypothetical protein